jgi:hypothetical protein
VIAVQDIILIADLVQLDRRDGFTLAHGLFDFRKPLGGHVFFGPEPGIKISVFTYTADNVFQRNGLNTVIHKFYILFLGLLFIERVHVIGCVLPVGTG